MKRSLVKAGLPEEVIIAKVQGTPSNFVRPLATILSRKDELEPDRLGLLMMAQAGIYPDYAAVFMESRETRWRLFYCRAILVGRREKGRSASLAKMPWRF